MTVEWYNKLVGWLAVFWGVQDRHKCQRILTFTKNRDFYHKIRNNGIRDKQELYRFCQYPRLKHGDFMPPASGS